jgi:hypothetical protein
MARYVSSLKARGSNAMLLSKMAGKKQREQMLKLVSNGFYNELINYVGKNEVLRVASHLLDNVLAQETNPPKAWSITTECLCWRR